MIGVGPPEILIGTLAVLSWLAGLAVTARKLTEKKSGARRLYFFLAVVAGPLGLFVAAAAWLSFPPPRRPAETARTPA